MQMFSDLIIKGLLVNKVSRENIDEKTGVVTTTNFLYFMMNNQKGLENVKIKDTDSLYADLTVGSVVEVPIRVTMSNMGVTSYEVAQRVDLDIKKGA